MGAVLLALAATIATTYQTAQHGSHTASLAVTAQSQLQTTLRALNDAVLSDGSSAARKLAQESAVSFSALLAELAERHPGDGLGELLATRVQRPGAR